jgi:Fur family ferric uptake transcriptional regulator
MYMRVGSRAIFDDASYGKEESGGVNMTQQLKKYEALLQQGGHRRTVQRQMILHVLEEAHVHLRMEQLAERVQAVYPQVNLSTIYRNVDLLTEMGVVRANLLPGEGTTYELADEKPHVHLVCQRCHEVTHVDPPDLERLKACVPLPTTFYPLSYSLVITGYCSACAAIVAARDE